MKLLPASLFLGLALGASAVSAATLTIGVTGDSYVRSATGSVNSNFNGSQLLLIGDVSTTDVLRGVLSFNLAAPELAGATINSVTLRLFADSGAGKDASSASSTETLQLFQLTHSFTETQVSWNNAATGTPWTTPGGDFASATMLSSVSANPSTVAINQEFAFGSSTAFLNSVVGTLAETDKTLGLYVKLSAEDATRSVFRLNAGSTTNVAIAPADFRPQLVIDYSVSSIPEPSSFAALAGLGALGLVGVRRRARR